MKRSANKWFGVLLLSLLAACAGNPVSPAASTADLERKAVAIISVSHDVGAKNGANAIFYLDEGRYPGRVVMKSVQDNLGVPVKSDFGGRRGHLYILELEPGSHSIDMWQVSSAGARISARMEPLKFEVKQGEAVYLGNLHAKLALGHRTLFGGRAATDARPFVLDQAEEDIALAESRVSALKGRVRVALLHPGPFALSSETESRLDPVVPLPVPAK